jgi:hypothetical protein
LRPEWAGKCKQAEEDRPPDFHVYLHGCVVVRFFLDANIRLFSIYARCFALLIPASTQTGFIFSSLSVISSTLASECRIRLFGGVGTLVDDESVMTPRHSE